MQYNDELGNQIRILVENVIISGLKNVGSYGNAVIRRGYFPSHPNFNLILH